MKVFLRFSIIIISIKYLNLILNLDYPERPDIEENDESCVVRIAPKSIKLKIKPLSKPEEAEDEREADVRVNDLRERSVSPVTNMHPKKKLAHMTDSIVNNFPVVNNLIHSTLPLVPTHPMSLSNHHINTKPPQNVLATRNGIEDDYEFKDEESISIEAFTKPTPVKPKKPNNENSVRKGRDVRTKCDVCLGEGSNTNLVRYILLTLKFIIFLNIFYFFRCDECMKCYHFGCLNPPVKKTPKVSGWAWSCSNCAPSDEDKGWHL